MGSMVIRILSPGSKGKVVRRDDAGSGHEECSVRESVFAEKVGGQIGRFALELRERGGAGKNHTAAAQDFDLDRSGGRQRIAADENARAQRATAVVDLGLRKIERIFALDIARAHIVADGVADDLAARVDEQRQLRLGNRPRSVGANAHVAAGAGDAARRGFEEKLRALGGVNAVVEIAAARVFRLGHARAAAAKVGNARGPDFLVADGGFEMRSRNIAKPAPRRRRSERR